MTPSVHKLDVKQDAGIACEYLSDLATSRSRRETMKVNKLALGYARIRLSERMRIFDLYATVGTFGQIVDILKKDGIRQ